MIKEHAKPLEKGETEAQMSYLQLLNVINAKVVARPSEPSKGLLHVEAKVNGKTTNPMIDIDATHNFDSMEEAKRLGLKLTKEKGDLKAVNSLAKPIEGVASNVVMLIGLWTGNVDLSVVHANDFQVVLGLEFMKQVKAVLCNLSVR